MVHEKMIMKNIEKKSSTLLQKLRLSICHKLQSARLLITIIIISIGPLICGVTLGFSSSVSAQLLLSDGLLSFFSSIINIGALLGCLFVAPVLNRQGRRLALFVSGIPSLIGWMMIAGARDLAPPAAPTPYLIFLLLTGRVLTGFAAGMLNATGAVYLVEVAPLAQRGRIGSLGQCAIVVGVCLSYAGGMYKTWYEVAQLLVVGSMFLLFLTIAYLPESPIWLARSNRPEAALAHLSWLRGDVNVAAAELEEIPGDGDGRHSPGSLARSRSKTLLDDASPPKPNLLTSLLFPCLSIPSELSENLRISILLMIGQQITGINVITFYTEPLCQNFVEISKSAQCAFSLGLAQVIFSVIASIFIDQFPRRLLIVATGVIMGTAMFIFALSQSFPDHIPISPLYPLIFFLFGFCLGWGPLAMLITLELFPATNRGAAGSAATSISWLAAFIVTQSFAPLKRLIGEFFTFVFFSGLTGVSTWYFYRHLPETNVAYFLPLVSSKTRVTQL